VKTPKLSTIPSTGPRLNEYYDADGSMYVHEWSTPCPMCGKNIVGGEDISYLRGTWAHAGCATTSLISGQAAGAWLALGSDLARHPRAYKTAETKLIVNQLLRLAAGMEPDAMNVEDVA
jgi:hypothetical protein